MAMQESRRLIQRYAGIVGYVIGPVARLAQDIRLAENSETTDHSVVIIIAIKSSSNHHDQH